MIAIDKSNLKNKFFRILNHIVSIIIIFAGIGTITNSLFGGLMVVLSGLLFSVIIKDIFNKKLFNNNLKSFKVINIIVFILFFAGLILAGNEGDTKRLIKDWDENKDKIVLNISKQIADGDLFGANYDLKKYESLAKGNSAFADVQAKYLNAVEEKEAKDKKIAAAKAAKEKEMAAAKEIEEQEQEITEQQATSSYSSDNDLSKVVAKVGSLIYLANQKTFAIERPTILHINGQMYPQGSGSPDYIQVGYRCRFTGTEYNVAEVFCER
ncbi:hypothetical protein MCEKH45_00644 [Methylophilaceae bacterium]